MEDNGIWNPVWRERDRDCKLNSIVWADCSWLVSEDLETLRNMMNELVKEIKNLGWGWSHNFRTHKFHAALVFHLSVNYVM